MASLHFSTIGLRNKLFQGCINNIFPLSLRWYWETTNKVKVRDKSEWRSIHLPQSCWREIRGFFHKEMNLRIKSSFYETLSKMRSIQLDNCIPATPQNLMTNPQQIETIVSLRKNQTKDMLKTLRLMSSEEANNWKWKSWCFTQALRAYYQQSAASQYNLDEALDVLVTLTDKSQKLVHAETTEKVPWTQPKTFHGIIYRMSRTIYTWSNKKSKTTAFFAPRDRSQSRPTQGGKMVNPANRKPKRPIRPNGFSPQEGESTAQKIKKILELLNLWNFTNNYVMSKIVNYVNGIVNLSRYTLTKSEINVLSKGPGFCPIPGAPDIGNIIQDLDAFKRKTRLNL